MQSLKEIKKVIEVELAAFEDKFKASLNTNVALIDRVMHYIIKRKGKQMRPMFVFLTHKLFTETNDRAYRAASLVELIHTATLVHDDVVDDTHLRRGFFSINALWKNKIAVLIGDYLLSRGLILSIDNGEFDMLRHISVAVREMSEGELLQMEKSRKLDISEKVYYEIIRQKTASLIATCCASGASSASQPQEIVEKMKLFGEYVGMAFQIKDDLFDYEKVNHTGKPSGNDIKEKKMTLPLIRALDTTDEKTKKHIIRTVKKHHNKRSKREEVIDFVMKSDGIQYAFDKMMWYRNEAIKLIEDIPENEAKKALIGLVDYSIIRKK